MAYGDAFSGFSLFGKVIWATVLLGLIITAIFVVPTAVIVGGALAGSGVLAGLGAVVLLAAMVAYVYLVIAWVYVFPVIVDRGLGVTAAMGESRRLVHGTGWWWTFLVLFLLQLVGRRRELRARHDPDHRRGGVHRAVSVRADVRGRHVLPGAQRGPAHRRGARLAAAGADRAAGLLGAGGALSRGPASAGAALRLASGRAATSRWSRGRRTRRRHRRCLRRLILPPRRKRRRRRRRRPP